MIYSIECFLKVNKNATNIITFINKRFNPLSSTDQCMISGIFGSKTKLMFINEIFIKKITHPGIDNFLNIFTVNG